MYPLPVRAFELDKMELRNNELVSLLDKKYIDYLKESTSRGKIGKYSLSKSIYKEGKLVSKMDKKVSRSQIKDFSSLLSLVTGHNKKLESKNEK